MQTLNFWSHLISQFLRFCVSIYMHTNIEMDWQGIMISAGSWWMAENTLFSGWGISLPNLALSGYC